MIVLNQTPIVAVYPIDPKYSEKRPNVCYCPAEYRPHTHVREGIDGMTNCCPLPRSGVGNCECGCVDVDQCGCECSFHINDDEEMGSQ